MSDDLKQYLKIDKHSLDEELVQQAELIDKVNDLWAEAAGERDALEAELEATEASLDKELRAAYKDDCTESKVKHGIKAHPRRLELVDMWLDAKLKANKLYGRKEAFSKRADMLEKLCQLYLGGYFTRKSVEAPVTSETVYRQRRAKT